jgi:hypothetical protein
VTLSLEEAGHQVCENQEYKSLDWRAFLTKHEMCHSSTGRMTCLYWLSAPCFISVQSGGADFAPLPSSMDAEEEMLMAAIAASLAEAALGEGSEQAPRETAEVSSRKEASRMHSTATGSDEHERESVDSSAEKSGTRQKT